MPAFLSQYIINELKAIDTIIYEAIDGCKTSQEDNKLIYE